LALPSSASATEASGTQQRGGPKQTAPAPRAAEAVQPQSASSNGGSSSNEHKDSGKPDLAQPKVKQEPLAENSAAGQPHEATNGLPKLGSAQQEHKQEQGSGSSSRAEQSVKIKQEKIPAPAESMQVDSAPQDPAHIPAALQEGSAVVRGPAGTAEGSAALSDSLPKNATGAQLVLAAEVAAVPGQAVQVAPLSADEAAERCELLCALCTKSPDLLRLLMEVFGKVQHGSLGHHHHLHPYIASCAANCA